MSLSLDRLSPMLLASGDTHPIEDEKGWAYEAKWDGFRVLAAFGGGRLQIRSRHGTDFTGAFPELAPLGRAGPAADPIVVDGELVCFDQHGHTSFARIRRRWGPGARLRAESLAKQFPATLVMFDLLATGGRSLMDRPYEERREALGACRLRDRHWLVTDFHVGQGAALAEASRKLGLEGLVAKRLQSRYRPGVRSADWRKLKNHKRCDFVVGGWLPMRTGGVEALYVGRRERGGLLSFEGTVEFGVGWRQGQLGEALALLSSDTSPFARWNTASRARWVRPLLVAKVRYIGYDAGVLREPILEGLTVTAR